MRHIFAVFKREILKILTSWQKALAIFLVPAAVMVFAINLFPKLIKYISTGSLGAQKVIVYSAPESFKSFGGKKEDNFFYEFRDNVQPDIDIEELSSDSIILEFNTYANEPDQFDNEIIKFYSLVNEGNSKFKTNAVVNFYYNDNSILADSKVYQFEEDVFKPYMASLGEEYLSFSDGSSISIDQFNPITYVLNHRSEANLMASHVVPGIMVLLMYYCVYSLSSDMLAQEKERGFLAKLQMTPVPILNILLGKMFAIVALVSVSAICTFLFMFLSSWLNTSNEAGSLLPFGMLLMPNQVFYMILAIPFCGFVMTAFCFKIIVDLEKYKDIIANLQLPLLLVLLDFFFQMFLYTTPVGAEYIVPFHNTTILIRNIFTYDVTLTEFVVVIVVDVVTGILLLRSCKRKMEGKKR